MRKGSKLSTDRIEEGFAVCQDLYTENMINIPLKLLPKNIKEGDILSTKTDGSFFVDKEETNKRRKKIIDLQNKIFKKSK